MLEWLLTMLGIYWITQYHMTLTHGDMERKLLSYKDIAEICEKHVINEI